MVNNPNCDGSGPHAADPEVRVLPIGGGENVILCNACFRHEREWRARRNRDLAEWARFALPSWADLEVYAP